ncbi:DMT family transporter [Sphingomonas sp. Leaf21]|uniref:DMT family transporter n=1 Tax=Sphingomonas sp. Leaf21 TaxID=2876550 RepID=UPI001E451B85|nr:DMT family transporter [Sphingomonas sp. Leaf21]
MNARPSPVIAFGAAALGIAIYSVMDTLMKRLSIDSGAYSAVLWRSWVGVAITAALFLARRGRWPGREALTLHVARGATGGASVLLFFWGLARVPMAQSIALTFLSPLIALFLAAVALGEKVRRAAIWGSLIAGAGVLVIAGGEVRAQASTEVVLGSLAILAASILYAVSLVLLRRQAQVAGPTEVALFTMLVIAVLMTPAAPFVSHWPAMGQWPAILAAALLGSLSALLLAWAYARAEAQILAPVEYTAFVWAACLGYAVFGERVSPFTLAGAALIIGGCVVAVRRPGPGPQSEAGL